MISENLSPARAHCPLTAALIDMATLTATICCRHRCNFTGESTLLRGSGEGGIRTPGDSPITSGAVFVPFGDHTRSKSDSSAIL
jgi:hypothetical protein